jgi:hypothetical protein
MPVAVRICRNPWPLTIRACGHFPDFLCASVVKGFYPTVSSGRLRAGLHFGEKRCGRGDEVLNSHVLPAHARPPRRMRPVVEMQKVAVIGSDAAIAKGRNLEREFVHLLERKAGDRNIGCHAESVFAIGDASHFLIVGGAAVAIVHHNFSSGKRAQLFEAHDEPVLDFQ